MHQYNLLRKHYRISQCVLLAILLTFLGCTQTDSISVAGSTTVLPIVSKAAEKFHALTGINVIVNAGGSGVGINHLASGQISIGMVSRDISTAEIKQNPDIKFVIHPIAKDAVVPVVSSEVYAAGIQALTLEQIGQIYLGEINNWQQLGGSDKAILVVDKEKSRGTRHVFMQMILGNEEALAPGADLVLGANNEEQTAITQSDAAIGMLSHAWLNEDVKGLAIILADGQVIEPTLENIKTGKFPISRELILVTNGIAVGSKKAFIDFILSTEGQQLITESGYVSLHE